MRLRLQVHHKSCMPTMFRRRTFRVKNKRYLVIDEHCSPANNEHFISFVHSHKFHCSNQKKLFSPLFALTFEIRNTFPFFAAFYFLSGSFFCFFFHFHSVYFSPVPVLLVCLWILNATSIRYRTHVDEVCTLCTTVIG